MKKAKLLEDFKKFEITNSTKNLHSIFGGTKIGGTTGATGDTFSGTPNVADDCDEDNDDQIIIAPSA